MKKELEELLKLSHKRNFNLQLFADDGGEGGSGGTDDPEDKSGDDEVGLNNTVQVYFEEDDETEEYKLVTSIRGNSMKGLISIESPLGKAIRGHRVGDRVMVKINETTGYYVEIKAIGKENDESQDEIRKF